jgi:hypothetical protein
MLEDFSLAGFVRWVDIAVKTAENSEETNTGGEWEWRQPKELAS